MVRSRFTLLAVAVGATLAATALSSAAAPRGPAVCTDRDEAPRDPQVVRLRATASGLGAVGTMELLMPAGPFGLAVADDGRQLYQVTLSIQRMRRRAGRTYVAWAATPELDQVHKLGVVGEEATVRGVVSWNQFLVLVSEEASPDVERWSGPIVLTGLSPSGLMHTMAGHGIFEDVDCAMYP